MIAVCHPVPAPSGRAAPRRGVRAAAAVAVLVGSATLAPARARACSCAAQPITLSQPADGAIDVPIDIAPTFAGYFETDTVELVREEGGEVAFDLNTGVNLIDPCAGDLAELMLEGPLEPNTTYVLRASLPDEAITSEVRFTTGTASVPEEPLSAPDITISFIRDTIVLDSCHGEVRGCLNVEGAQEAEVTITRSGSRPLWGLVRGNAAFDTGTIGAPDCVRVRARDAAGRRSTEVTTLCRGDYSLRDSVESDFEDYVLRCEQGVIGDGDPPSDLPDLDAGAQRSEDAGAVEDRADARMPGRRTSIGGSGRGCAVAATPDGASGAAAALLVLLGMPRRRSRSFSRPTRIR